MGILREMNESYPYRTDLTKSEGYTTDIERDLVQNVPDLYDVLRRCYEVREIDAMCYENA